jgi:hypothetical protein
MWASTSPRLNHAVTAADSTEELAMSTSAENTDDCWNAFMLLATALYPVMAAMLVNGRISPLGRDDIDAALSARIARQPCTAPTGRATGRTRKRIQTGRKRTGDTLPKCRRWWVTGISGCNS